MEIISFDKSRIYTTVENNHHYLYKKTSLSEVENLKKAKEYIDSKSLKLEDSTFTIEIPKVNAWDETTEFVKMDYFQGYNLEKMLRTISTRQDAVTILNKLLEFILLNNFYWVDFSPRNILINYPNKKICFVDFEKGLSLDNNSLISYFRNHVFEEYSSFLLYDERIINGEEIFKLNPSERDIQIIKNDIKIKRVKATANKLNYPDIITQDQFLQIFRIILIAELPQLEKNGINFPRIELEKILESKNINPEAYNYYADTIIDKYQENVKCKKIHY